MSNQNSNIHAHHRQRLRHRFNTYGYVSFEEHNMLELILFYAVPYKDTNPIAHNLIRRFGSFYDVFRADPKEMTEVSGVGEYAAEFLRFLNFSSDVAVHQGIFSKSKLPQYKTIDEVGKMLCSHLSSRAGGIYMTLFNSNHELIGTTLLAREGESVYKIDRNIMLSQIIGENASDVVLSQYKPNGVAIPLFDDMNAATEMRSELSLSGIRLAEFFVVTENDYTPVLKNCSFGSSPRFNVTCSHAASPSFDEGTKPELCSVATLTEITDPNASFNSLQILEKLLSYSAKRTAKQTSERLISKYGNLYEVISLDSATLAEEGINEITSTLFRIVLSLKKYIAEKTLTQDLTLSDTRSVLLLLNMMFFGDKRESFILLTFDREKRFIGAHRIGEGTVNSVAIANRLAIELAVDSASPHVIFAHNHPRGTAQPSPQDIACANSLRISMESVNIKLHANYIISNGKYVSI